MDIFSSSPFFRLKVKGLFSFYTLKYTYLEKKGKLSFCNITPKSRQTTCKILNPLQIPRINPPFITREYRL